MIKKFKIANEITLEEFGAWSGAVDTKEVILDHDKGGEFDGMIDELYPDGLTENDLNDLLLFEDEWIYKSLGIELEDDDE